MSKCPQAEPIYELITTSCQLRILTELKTAYSEAGPEEDQIIQFGSYKWSL